MCSSHSTCATCKAELWFTCTAHKPRSHTLHNIRNQYQRADPLSGVLVNSSDPCYTLSATDPCSSTPSGSSAKAWFMIVFCQAKGLEHLPSRKQMTRRAVLLHFFSVCVHPTGPRGTALDFFPTLLSHAVLTHYFCLPSSRALLLFVTNRHGWWSYYYWQRPRRVLCTSSTQRESGTITSGSSYSMPGFASS